MPMENFFKIRAEKQAHIVNAAFMVFGKQGYRKASLSDIAKEAGITKGMITYYFGSKKMLYMYLMEICQAQIIDRIQEKISKGGTDFFEGLRTITDIYVKAVKEHPSLVSFINSSYYETDPEVADIIEKQDEWECSQTSYFLESVDESQFKPESSPKLICKLLFWSLEGFMMELFETDHATNNRIDEIASQFYQCLDIMQAKFYKE